MNRFSSFILRFSAPITALGVLLSVSGGYYSVQLYKNLRTDLEELLPTTVRSVLDLNEVTHRLESVENLAVLVFSENTEESKRFVNDLALKLEKAPKDTIASVEYRIDQELKFFKDRRALYMDLPDLIKTRDYIKDRIEYEKDLYNPLNIFSEDEIPEPQLDLRGMKKKYDHKVSAYSRFPDGYYATPDGKKRVVLVYVPGKASGVATNYRLKSFVENAVSELGPQSYSVEVKYTGGVQNLIEEQSALVKDLGVSSLIVIFMVTFVLLAFFRNVRATLALLLSLFMGTFFTFGVAYFIIGYLNANSAFLGSIIIGNGINFGTIYLARYLEERKRGTHHFRSTHLAMTHTATATWTAALAAGLSYGSLTLTGFRGFKQFGVIGLIGMVFCWITAFTLLPAILTLFDRFKPLCKKGASHSKSVIPDFVASVINRNAKIIWGISFGFTLISLAAFIVHNNKNILETDLSKLRNKKSFESGSAFLWKHVDEIFQRYISPLVILPKSREDVSLIAEALKEKTTREGKNSLIASVQSLDDFIPKDQTQKIEILKEIRKTLRPSLLRRLSSGDQNLVKEFITGEVFKPIRIPDLPKLVLSKFTEKDQSIGKLVLVEPPLNDSLLKGDNLITFIHELRETADSVAPGTPVAGTLPISADMIEAISTDGPRATLLAFIAVVLLVIFFFRDIKTISLVLFALILGATWMTGIILGFGLKINFLNFIALPITFGIGVDYGVNIFQRYQEERNKNILRVIRHTGGAVGLCSLTTIIGYSSLLLAENQAFFSFGLLAVLGELTCVIAAVISLPAYLIYMERKKTSK